MTNEIYTSSTLGEIPLSFTGRHLLQSLREAIEEALEEQAKGRAPRFVYNLHDQAISRIRGKLAKQMSHLEKQVSQLKARLAAFPEIREVIIHDEPPDKEDIKELLLDLEKQPSPASCFTAVSLNGHAACLFVVTRMEEGMPAEAGHAVLKLLLAAQGTKGVI